MFLVPQHHSCHNAWLCR